MSDSTQHIAVQIREKFADGKLSSTSAILLMMELLLLELDAIRGFLKIKR